MVPCASAFLRRHRDNVNVQGFIKGACAAAIGDWLTVLIAAASLLVLFRFKMSNPALVGVSAAVGLIAFPILQPAWVFVR